LSYIAEAVQRGDLDELTRFADRLCDAGDFDVVLDLRDRCRKALERGRQLWPVASYCEYRLALDGPGELAAAVLVEGTGHLALGPLPEVAAQRHTWAELAPHAVPGPAAAMAAHERVVRGEDLREAGVAHAEVLAVPLCLQPWEPAYDVPRYRSDRVELTGPIAPRGRALDLPAEPASALPDDDAVLALREVTRTWTVGSEARVHVVGVEGDIRVALRALGTRSARVARLDGSEALGFVAWAAASGGVHGRRRGAAAGRDVAWATAAALAGFEPAEPVGADELGEAVSELAWWWWGTGDEPAGWVLRVAVEDPAEGLAWAVDAVDPS
jgi:hypothetical protein